MKSCNQLCPWNTLYGCQKPESEPCILSNVACEKFEPKPQTNADHIRSMTDDELAGFIFGISDMTFENAEGWLKRPYKEDT